MRKKLQKYLKNYTAIIKVLKKSAILIILRPAQCNVTLLHQLYANKNTHKLLE